MKKEKRSRHGLMSFRWMMPTILVLTSVLLDTSVLPLFYNGIYAPNITMAMILALVVRRPGPECIAYAIGAGLLLDISNSYPVGLYTATLAVCVILGFLCALFSRNVGKFTVLFIVYLIQEFVFLMIAYAYTIRMEWAYLIPMLIRICISIVLCAVLQLLVERVVVRRGVKYTRNRRK